MRIYIFIGVLLLQMGLGNVLFAQRILGRYSNREGTEIVIDKDRFVVLSAQHNPHIPPELKWRICDTIAICSWEYVSNDIIRIENEPIQDIIKKSCSVSTGEESSLPKDSIKIVFNLPETTFPIDICIRQWSDDGEKLERTFRYPQEKEVLVSNGYTEFYFTSPDYLTYKKEPPYMGQDEYFPIAACYPYPCLTRYIDNQEKGDNIIFISIPIMNDAFFEYVWINGDYVFLSEDSLLWHNMTFHTKSQQKELFPPIRNYVEP